MKSTPDSSSPDGPGAKPAALEDLTFHPSPGPSIGVEVELQILDRESGDLAPGSVRILQACAEESLEGATAELIQSMLEVKTDVCRDVAEVRDTLLPRLRRVHHIASSLGYDLALGGTHPFNRSTSNAVFPAERYQRIQERMAWLTYQVVVFGLHVHVGMPDGDTALGVSSALVSYLPHLLALSANSPFWGGVDTGLASTRAALFRLAPHAAVPPHFASWKHFCRYCEVMHACQAIRSTKDIYWDVRPRPQQGTVEVRICDTPASLATLLGLAALIRCLAIAAQRRIEARPRLRRGDVRRHWVAVENKWRASRYGLKARCVRAPGARPRRLAADLEHLLDHLSPLAREMGDAPFLDALRPIRSFETGADRQRHLYRETGSWQAVIEDMKGRWARELEGDGPRS